MVEDIYDNLDANKESTSGGISVDSANPEAFSTIGQYYKHLYDLILTYPERAAEYLQSAQDIAKRSHSSEDLAIFYDMIESLVNHTNDKYGNNKNLEEHFKQHPEIKKQIARLYMSHLQDDNLGKSSADNALRMVDNIYSFDSETGFSLIKQFYDLSVKTGIYVSSDSRYSNGKLANVINDIINKSEAHAQKFLTLEKEILTAAKGGHMEFYPYSFNLLNKYPDLLPQVQDLLKQELQIKTDENSVGRTLSKFKLLTKVPMADSALYMIQSALERVKFEDTKERYGFNPLRDTYKAVNTILQSGNASYAKGLQIVETGLKNNNHQLSSALDILKTISAKPEYVDECIDLTKLMHNNEDSETYGDRNISEEKAEFLCKIMEDHPEKINKCLPILLEMLPTSYEKPQPKSDEDEFADMLREDDEDIKPKRQPRRARRAWTEDDTALAQNVSMPENTEEKIPSREEIIAQNIIHNTETLSEITRSILEVAPDKFAECLPAMQKVANEGYSSKGGNIIAVTRQLMNTHPSECADLFITCVDKHSYGNYGYQKYADNVLETVEELIAVKPEINQEAQQKLIDAVWNAGYYAAKDEGDDYLYRGDVDEKLMKEKRDSVYLKMFQSKAFSEETGTNIINKINSNDKDFYDRLLTEKLCTPKQVIQILSKLKEKESFDEIAKLAKQNYADNDEVKTTLKAIQTERRNKQIIDDVLNERPAGKKVEALIRLADAVVKTKDDKQINQFKDMLFCKGEEYVFDIDKKAMDWFVNNGKPEDLEALNNLSQLYGIKTELSEYYTIEPAQNAAYRIQFSGEYSEIGKVENYITLYDDDGDRYYEGIENPHYFRMLSEGYQKFKPDYSRDYKPSDYNLRENAAYNTLLKHGVAMPEKLLQEALAEIHMPVTLQENDASENKITFRDLNATDLQHLMINYYHLKEGQNYHRDDHDMESSEILSKRIKEKRKGDSLPMKYISDNAPQAIREKLWQFYAANEQMVEFVSNDWRRMGVSEEVIEDTWKNAAEIGYPVDYDVDRRDRTVRSHYGLDNNLHHAEALRVGGTNKTLMDCKNQKKLGNDVNSIVLTNNLHKAHTETVTRYSDGEMYEKELHYDGGKFAINSHDPFHLYDNPCVYLYLKASDGKLTVKEKADDLMKRMMVTRTPSAYCRADERIVYFGGPRECSCAIMDSRGNVRQASYDFWKDDPNKEKTNVVAKEVKMDVSARRRFRELRSANRKRA